MSDENGSPLTAILRHCAAAAPEPWYPSIHVRQSGVARDSLDPHLDWLRLGGLVQLTDWIKDTGQGYRLTTEGERVLHSPGDLHLLERGQLPGQEPAAAFAGPQRPATNERSAVVRAALREHHRPVATIALLTLNIGVFLVGLAQAQGQQRMNEFVSGSGTEQVWTIQHTLGAVTGGDIVEGQWWKLLGCCFVHFGLLHLGVNMYTLYVIGPMVEQMWGRWRFLFIYLVSGVAGSCTAVLMHPETRLAGASGALWGLMLSEVTWVLLNRRFLPAPIPPAWIRSRLTIFLVNIFISMIPYVSASAHFGGGLAGVIAAGLANTQRFATRPLRWAALLSMVLLPGLCVGAVAYEKRTDTRWHAQEYAAFDQCLTTPLKHELDVPLQFYEEHLKDLIENYRPERRDPAAVEQSLPAGTAHRARLSALAHQLDAAGPYSDPAVAAALEAARKEMAATIEFYDLAASCLRPASNGKAEEKALAAQKRRVVERAAAWGRSWAQARASQPRWLRRSSADDR